MYKLKLIKTKPTNLFIVRKCFLWSRPHYPFTQMEYWLVRHCGLYYSLYESGGTTEI